MEEANNLLVLFEKAVIAKTSPGETHKLVLKSRDVIGQQRKFAIECQERCKQLEELYVKRDKKLIQEKYQAEKDAEQLKMQCDGIRKEIASKHARRNTMMAEKRELENRINNYRHEKEQAEIRRNNAVWFYLIPVAGLIVAPIVAAVNDADVHRFNDRINSLHCEMNNLESEINRNQHNLSDLENKINLKNNQINSTTQKIKNTQNKMREMRQIVAFCVQACNVWKELDTDGRHLEIKASTFANVLQKYTNTESQSLKFFRSRAFTNSATSFYSNWIDFTKAIQDKSDNGLQFKCERCSQEYNGLPFTKHELIICENCYQR
ncbi:hypothetical protein C1645_781617 [Glomus cerebriforme]|uniref:Uncharacterized protein n=1 Tax=Glomus cerebriforme TaxID=658196 RepID=A0A397SBY9_9GLOM|nr:hypothetical protein C1645_786291 [Glomus cerebriforme]RIA85587.1 hypothetical protein C1645_781617 [Glomus cerebriforme]